jgi:peptide/nickel transport system permease protein
MASVTVADGKSAQRSTSYGRRMLRRFLKNRLAVFGLLVLLLLVISAVMASVIASHSPLEMSLQNRLQPPSLAHPFGTDDFGRDIFSRVIHGSAISLKVGATAVSISLVVGVYLGVNAGYWGGRLDALIMRVMDVLLAFPAILLAISIMAILGPSTVNVMIAIGIVSIPVFARIIRGSVLAIKEQDFVEAARATGLRDWQIAIRHVFPNAMDAVIVQASLALANAILAEAALSFLGLGTQPPAPSWGAMLSFGREYIVEAPWLSIFPGLAIFVTVFALNLVGDGLRDTLDPRLKDA